MIKNGIARVVINCFVVANKNPFIACVFVFKVFKLYITVFNQFVYEL
jgi:hypothetical protein